MATNVAPGWVTPLPALRCAKNKMKRLNTSTAWVISEGVIACCLVSRQIPHCAPNVNQVQQQQQVGKVRCEYSEIAAVEAVVADGL